MLKQLSCVFLIFLIINISPKEHFAVALNCAYLRRNCVSVRETNRAILDKTTEDIPNSINGPKQLIGATELKELHRKWIAKLQGANPVA